MWIVFFWIMTSCSLVGGYQSFWKMYRLHLKDISTLKTEEIHFSGTPVVIYKTVEICYKLSDFQDGLRSMNYEVGIT
jgi:hypothetical protein